MKTPKRVLRKISQMGAKCGKEDEKYSLSQWSFLVSATQGVCLRNMSSLPLVIEAKPLNNAQLV